MSKSFKNTINFVYNLLKDFSKSAVSGNSIAEFAVITAMMSTFVATAAPRLSSLMEVGKTQKSIQEIDKILLQAKNFYETTATYEGRGRLPGQDKFNLPVGSYGDTLELYYDLAHFTSYSNVEIGNKWVSVFGVDTKNGHYFNEDLYTPDVDDASGEILCKDCPEARESGSLEWYHLFNQDILESPFQDGHFIYVVIPGSGSGEDVIAPRIIVADAENPSTLHKIMDL